MITEQMGYNPIITYMKAVAIMLMVLCHCWDCSLLNRLVYAFHMPLFFIVSGFCFKTKYLKQPLSFVWKRIKGLWWPYMKWGTVFLALHNIFYHMNVYNDLYGYIGHVQHLYTKDEYLQKYLHLFQHMATTEQLLGGFWFVKSLFIGALIAYIVIFVCSLMAKYFGGYMKLSHTLGGGFLLIACLIINYEHKTFTIYYICPRDFLAATFFIFGHCLALGQFPRFKFWQGVVAFVIMATNSFYFQIGIGLDFYETYKIIPYTLSAILGTWCIYSLPWQKFNSKIADLTCYIGKHTLEILTWHFLCFKIVSLLIISIYGLPINRLAEFPMIGEYSNKGWFVAYFTIGVGIPILVTYGISIIRKHIILCLKPESTG